MKKIIVLTGVALMIALGAAAQTTQIDSNRGIAVKNSGISVTGQNIALEDDEMSVQLDVTIGRRAARSGHTVVWRPFITDGTSRWALPELVVQHRRARIAEGRHNWTAGIENLFDNPTFVLNGETVRYTARVPYQDWMGGGELIVETIDMGCCGSDKGAALLAYGLPARLLPEPEPEPEPLPEPEPEPTTGERLTECWVSPIEEFNPDVMDDCGAALEVYFRWDNSVLDPDFKANGEVLEQFMEVIATLEASSDSRVAKVMVAGFASPEGALGHNDVLAFNRATALKNYIAEHSPIDGERIHIYNGAEDWDSLRAMVEASEMAQREEILRIIDTVPIKTPAGTLDRERRLARLAGGVPWRHMTREFFPVLRKAACIRVFYENK